MVRIKWKKSMTLTLMGSVAISLFLYLVFSEFNFIGKRLSVIDSEMKNSISKVNQKTNAPDIHSELNKKKKLLQLKEEKGKEDYEEEDEDDDEDEKHFGSLHEHKYLEENEGFKESHESAMEENFGGRIKKNLDSAKDLVHNFPPSQKKFREEEFLDLFARVKKLPSLKGKKLKDLNIAIVKQDVYNNLYCIGRTNDYSQIVGSTLKHYGPIGFFSPAFNSSFYITQTDLDFKDTSIWKEKLTDCGFKHTLEDYIGFKNKLVSVVDRHFICEHWQYALQPHEINWKDYDIVISLDISVSHETTSKYPQTVWAYFITEGCMTTYTDSFIKPVNGYDLYLTQDYNMETPLSLKEHVIEFPFSFSYSELFFDIFQIPKIDPLQRNGIILCRGHGLTDEEISKIREVTGQEAEKMHGTPRLLREIYMKSKYFIYFGGKKSRGNALGEAMSAGLLCITSHNVVNIDLMLISNTLVSTFDQLINLLTLLESDQQKYLEMRNFQQKVFNFLSFDRPLYQLIQKSQAVIDSREHY